MKTFLEPLVLPQRPRLFVQLAVSLFFVLTITASYINFPKYLDSTQPGISQTAEVKTWVAVLFCVLAIVPAAYTFNLIRHNLDLDFDPA